MEVRWRDGDTALTSDGYRMERKNAQWRFSTDDMTYSNIVFTDLFVDAAGGRLIARDGHKARRMRDGRVVTYNAKSSQH